MSEQAVIRRLEAQLRAAELVRDQAVEALTELEDRAGSYQGWSRAYLDDPEFGDHWARASKHLDDARAAARAVLDGAASTEKETGGAAGVVDALDSATEDATADGVTVNVANIRRAVFDAEVEYKLALRTVSDDEAAQHRDEILEKWLTNLGVFRASTVGSEEQ